MSLVTSQSSWLSAALKTLKSFENHKHWVSWNKNFNWDSLNNDMIYSICLKVYNLANISIITSFLIFLKLWKLWDVLRTTNIESAGIKILVETIWIITVYSLCLKVYDLGNFSIIPRFLVFLKLWKLWDVCRTTNIESIGIKI